jgi:hypothetical protein
VGFTTRGAADSETPRQKPKATARLGAARLVHISYIRAGGKEKESKKKESRSKLLLFIYTGTAGNLGRSCGRLSGICHLPRQWLRLSAAAQWPVASELLLAPSIRSGPSK